MTYKSVLTHVKPSLAFFRVILYCFVSFRFEMSSSPSGTCLDAIFSEEFVLSSWERYFESTVHVLGNSGAICSLPAHAKFNKFTHAVFLVRNPEHGLVAFQICSSDSSFVASSLEAEAIKMSFTCDILCQILFCRLVSLTCFDHEGIC
jgi:hypothetical protein